MTAMKSTGLTLKRVTLKANGFTYQSHRVAGTINGQRIRKFFHDRNVAVQELTRLQVEALNGSHMRPVMTRMNEAQVSEAEAAFKRLAGKPLSFAVDWFLGNYREATTTLPVSALKDAFLADRAARGNRPVTLKGYRQAMTDLANAMGAKPLPEITTDDILAYLEKKKHSRPKSWNNDRADLNTFFAWAMKAPRRYIAKNPVSEIEKRKVVKGMPERMTADQVAAVMKEAETFEGGKLAGFLALAFFSGIRPCARTGELLKLISHPRAAEFINFGTGYIILPPEITKTDQHRQVKMEPNLIAWLKHYPAQLPPNIGDKLGVLRKKFKMGKDVTRHTYVSMHAAAFESIGGTAQQAGNSESMIKRHYLNTVTPEEAAKFWQIVPLQQKL